MVKQNIIDIFIKDIYHEPTKKYYDTNETVVKHIHDTWSLDLLDMIDYGIKNIRGYRYNLAVIDNFSKYRFGVPLKNKAARNITNEFSNILH